MSGWTYVAIWPIQNQDLPISTLTAQACLEVDGMAEAAGAKIIGDPKWTVTDRRLVCRAPARPLRDDERLVFTRAGRITNEAVLEILRLIGAGLADSAVARRVGVDRKTVARYRALGDVAA